jgi:putative transposase
MKQKRAYRYRFHPTYEQEQQLARPFGCVRYCYNWALHLKIQAYRERGERLGYGDLSARFTLLKQQPETIWLNEVSCVPLQQSLRHLDRAFVNFFQRRAAYPKFKRKGGPQAAEYTKSAFTWDGTSLTLAKMREPLAIVWSRPLPAGSLPSTVTVSKDTAGRYFVSILLEEDLRLLEVVPQMVGLDLGISSLVILSTGEKIGNPHFFRRDEKKLARAQRRLAKKRRASRNREKARRKVARIHARIADKRRDYQHKLSSRLIRENQVICVESFAVKHMLQNHSLAKAIADVGWSELLRQLEYKSRWYGRALRKIDRFEPSSKRCFTCKHLLDDLDLSVREWVCPSCGTFHDRDTNAANNIRAAGLAVYAACGEGVRPVRALSPSGTSRRSRKSSS